MATLEEVRASIHTLLDAELTDVRFAPLHPTEMLAVYPAMVVYVQDVVWSIEIGGNSKLGLAAVVVEVHVQRAKGLHNAISDLQPYMESIATELITALRDGTFSQRFTFGEIRVELVAGEWGTDATMAARATINDVKVRNSVA
jgi:hypothetical protein